MKVHVSLRVVHKEIMSLYGLHQMYKLKLKCYHNVLKTALIDVNIFSAVKLKSY